MSSVLETLLTRADTTTTDGLVVEDLKAIKKHSKPYKDIKNGSDIESEIDPSWEGQHELQILKSANRLKEVIAREKMSPCASCTRSCRGCVYSAEVSQSVEQRPLNQLNSQDVEETGVIKITGKTAGLTAEAKQSVATAESVGLINQDQLERIDLVGAIAINADTFKLDQTTLSADQASPGALILSNFDDKGQVNESQGARSLGLAPGEQSSLDPTYMPTRENLSVDQIESRNTQNTRTSAGQPEPSFVGETTPVTSNPETGEYRVGTEVTHSSSAEPRANALFSGEVTEIPRKAAQGPSEHSNISTFGGQSRTEEIGTPENNGRQEPLSQNRNSSNTERFNTSEIENRAPRASSWETESPFNPRSGSDQTEFSPRRPNQDSATPVETKFADRETPSDSNNVHGSRRQNFNAGFCPFLARQMRQATENLSNAVKNKLEATEIFSSGPASVLASGTLLIIDATQKVVEVQADLVENISNKVAKAAEKIKTNLEKLTNLRSCTNEPPANIDSQTSHLRTEISSTANFVQIHPPEQSLNSSSQPTIGLNSGSNDRVSELDSRNVNIRGVNQEGQGLMTKSSGVGRSSAPSFEEHVARSDKTVTGQNGLTAERSLVYEPRKSVAVPGDNVDGNGAAKVSQTDRRTGFSQADPKGSQVVGTDASNLRFEGTVKPNDPNVQRTYAVRSRESGSQVEEKNVLRREGPLYASQNKDNSASVESLKTIPSDPGIQTGKIAKLGIQTSQELTVATERQFRSVQKEIVVADSGVFERTDANLKPNQNTATESRGETRPVNKELVNQGLSSDREQVAENRVSNPEKNQFDLREVVRENTKPGARIQSTGTVTASREIKTLQRSVSTRGNTTNVTNSSQTSMSSNLSVRWMVTRILNTTEIIKAQIENLKFAVISRPVTIRIRELAQTTLQRTKTLVKNLKVREPHSTLRNRATSLKPSTKQNHSKRLGARVIQAQKSSQREAVIRQMWNMVKNTLLSGIGRVLANLSSRISQISFKKAADFKQRINTLRSRRLLSSITEIRFRRIVGSQPSRVHNRKLLKISRSRTQHIKVNLARGESDSRIGKPILNTLRRNIHVKLPRNAFKFGLKPRVRVIGRKLIGRSSEPIKFSRLRLSPNGRLSKLISQNMKNGKTTLVSNPSVQILREIFNQVSSRLEVPADLVNALRKILRRIILPDRLLKQSASRQSVAFESKRINVVDHRIYQLLVQLIIISQQHTSERLLTEKIRNLAKESPSFLLKFLRLLARAIEQKTGKDIKQISFEEILRAMQELQTDEYPGGQDAAETHVAKSSTSVGKFGSKSAQKIKTSTPKATLDLETVEVV